VLIVALDKGEDRKEGKEGQIKQLILIILNTKVENANRD